MASINHQLHVVCCVDSSAARTSAYSCAIILLEVQDTLREPPAAAKSMKKTVPAALGCTFVLVRCHLATDSKIAHSSRVVLALAPPLYCSSACTNPMCLLLSAADLLADSTLLSA